MLTFMGWLWRRTRRAVSGTAWAFGLTRAEIGRKTLTLPLLALLGLVAAFLRGGPEAVAMDWHDLAAGLCVAFAAFMILLFGNWLLAPYRLESEARREVESLRDLGRIAGIRRMFADAVIDLRGTVLNPPRPPRAAARWRERFSLLVESALIPQARNRFRDLLEDPMAFVSKDIDTFPPKDRLFSEIITLADDEFDHAFRPTSWARWPQRNHAGDPNL